MTYSAPQGEAQISGLAIRKEIGDPLRTGLVETPPHLVSACAMSPSGFNVI